MGVHGEETTAKKRSSLSEAMTKKVVRFFKKKIWRHPSVDTNHSGATDVAGPVCCEPRHRRVRRRLSACVDAEGGHFEHYL